MAISIKDFKDTVDDLLDKNNARESTAQEFTRITNISQLELFDDLLGTTNKRLDNRTGVAYGRSQSTDQRLEPFRATATIDVTTDGEVKLPDELAQITGVYSSKAIPKALSRIDEDRLGTIFDNPFRKPNEDEIYYTELGQKKLQVFGLTDSVYVAYIRKPISCKYAEVDAEIQAGSRTVTRKVYDPTESVDLEWDERETLDLVNRVLDKLTMPIKDVFTSQKVQINKTNE